jgi:hypothetical protein
MFGEWRHYVSHSRYARKPRARPLSLARPFAVSRGTLVPHAGRFSTICQLPILYGNVQIAWGIRRFNLPEARLGASMAETRYNGAKGGWV